MPQYLVLFSLYMPRRIGGRGEGEGCLLPAVEVDGAGNDGIRQLGENGTSHKGSP